MLIIATNFKEFQNYSAERTNDLNHVLVTQKFKNITRLQFKQFKYILQLKQVSPINRNSIAKKTIIPLVLGFVGDTVVALVCEAFVGVVTKMNLKMFSLLVLTI